MSLTGKTPTVTSQQTTANGIYPAVEVQAFVDRYRLPEVYEPALICEQLEIASHLVQDHLSEAANGIATLSDSQVTLYKRAVMLHARGMLVPYYETLNRAQAAEVQGERGAELVSYWEEMAHRVTDLLANSLGAENWRNTNGTRVVLL